jgi:hypothetical protein
MVPKRLQGSKGTNILLDTLLETWLNKRMILMKFSMNVMPVKTAPSRHVSTPHQQYRQGSGRFNGANTTSAIIVRINIACAYRGVFIQPLPRNVLTCHSTYEHLGGSCCLHVVFKKLKHLTLSRRCIHIYPNIQRHISVDRNLRLQNLSIIVNIC